MTITKKNVWQSDPWSSEAAELYHYRQREAHTDINRTESSKRSLSSLLVYANRYQTFPHSSHSWQRCMHMHILRDFSSSWVHTTTSTMREELWELRAFPYLTLTLVVSIFILFIDWLRRYFKLWYCEVIVSDFNDYPIKNQYRRRVWLSGIC